uniref:Uncharacterized protein n=1 Tax=Siphoviridae sp. ctFH16 TaxID=2827817 RepID=A0A8S5TN77_9CAUD|nr:MAG TPA: hypothetical protein [Siphoviridae sp. ctFH16]
MTLNRLPSEAYAIFNKVSKTRSGLKFTNLTSVLISFFRVV